MTGIDMNDHWTLDVYTQLVLFPKERPNVGSLTFDGCSASRREVVLDLASKLHLEGSFDIPTGLVTIKCPKSLRGVEIHGIESTSASQAGDPTYNTVGHKAPNSNRPPPWDLACTDTASHRDPAPEVHNVWDVSDLKKWTDQ